MPPVSKSLTTDRPLSPLLSNLVLDELDQELERRGHRFVRLRRSAPMPALWQCFPSTKFVCDALHSASPYPERLGQLQDTDTLRKLLSHPPFGGWCEAVEGPGGQGRGRFPALGDFRAGRDF